MIYVYIIKVIVYFKIFMLNYIYYNGYLLIVIFIFILFVFVYLICFMLYFLNLFVIYFFIVLLGLNNYIIWYFNRNLSCFFSLNIEYIKVGNMEIEIIVNK